MQRTRVEMQELVQRQDFAANLGIGANELLFRAHDLDRKGKLI